MKQVRIESVNVQLFLRLNELHEYQGDLAEITPENLEKLKQSIDVKGFFVPFFVWNDSGSWRIVDGHQRKLALLSMKSDGWSVPEKFPCIEIVAGSCEDAREKLLLVTGQYKHFNVDAVERWIDELGDFALSCSRLVDTEITLNLDLNLPSVEVEEENRSGKKECVCPECGAVF